MNILLTLIFSYNKMSILKIANKRINTSVITSYHHVITSYHHVITSYHHVITS